MRFTGAMRYTPPLLAALIALTGPASAESGAGDGVGEAEAEGPPGLEKGVTEYRAWGGIAVTATAGFGGLRPDEASGRESLLLAARYGRVVATLGGLSFEYVADVVPVEMTFQTIVGSGGAEARANVYGAGLRPLGFALSRRSGRVKPFVGFTGGIVAFTDVVPLPDTRQLDFTADLEAGASIARRGRRALILGATLHHISNWGRAATNRGLNSFLVFAGLSAFRWGRPL